MKHAPKVWMRRMELALWFVGLSLLATAAGATFARWNYQTQQERVLFALERGPAVGVSIPEDLLPKASAPAEMYGPPAPAPPPPSIVRKKPRPVSLDPGAIGLIEIPRLRLTAVVREGADEKTLARAVGLVPGTAHPGQIGNMVLAGHRDTFFRPLRRIRVNDRIRVVVPPNTYEYQVQATRVVEPHETDVLASRGDEELTLVTCYPFRFIGPAPERFIVSATRVN